MKSFLLFCLCGVLFLASAQAQNQTQKRIWGPGIRPPGFFPIPQPDIPIFLPPTVKVNANETPIKLQKIEIKVRVKGLETETTTTMTFQNPNPRLLEGGLEFPLPSDASVTGYALDVNGTLIDGVIVPKEKARVVLETEMRRKVDPGILEHVAGNFFRTRIYPFPPLGTRTIRITSVAPLTLIKGDAAMHIPLPRGLVIPELLLEVSVENDGKKPEIGGFGNLTFSEWNNSWTAKANLKNANIDNDLFVNLPKLPEQVIAVEQFEGEFYASISDAPKVKSTQDISSPIKLRIAWDASCSRDPASVKKDREFLTELFKKWKNPSIELTVFRNILDPVRIFQVKNGLAPEFFNYLDQLAYDGGTQLSAVHFQKGNGEPWLLFTDGFENIKEKISKFDAVPVHVISSSTARNTSLLRFLSDATGGLFIDLTTKTAAAGAQLIVNPSLTLLRVENSAGDVTDIQSRFQPGTDRASVYAKFKKDTVLQLVYGFNGKEILRNSIVLKTGGAKTGELIARTWAASRAMELAVFAEKNESELIKLGRKYHLVTPGTSLIVLERVDQYVTYEIEPPNSMPQWRESYFATLKQRQQNTFLNEKNKIDTVLTWWKNRVEWWNKKYDYPKDFVYKSGYGTGQPENSGGPLGMGSSQGGMGGMLGSGDMVAPNSNSQESDSGTGSALSAAAFRSNKLGAGAAQSANKSDTRNETASIIIKEYNPTTPYLNEIKANPQQAYKTYLTQRMTYATSPSFYFDCANYFYKTNRMLAERVLSNLAELKLDDPSLLRKYAWRLQEVGELDNAIDIFSRVRKLRPEEPQSHRDLALIYSQRLDRDKKIDDGVQAVTLLNQVVLGNWPRFAEVEIIALMELNRVIKAMERIDKGSIRKVAFVDKRLRKVLDLDVRITLSWDTDATDLDLHVIEPSGEEANYSHPNTTIGGLVSRDFTNGYGPEEYIVRRAMPGIYKIRTKYYGSSRQNLLGPVTATATVITHFGKPNEKRQTLTLQLNSASEIIDIGEITFGTSEKNRDSNLTSTTISKDVLKTLKKGMDQDAVIKVLGLPERKEGGALTVLLYRLKDGKQIRIGFGPELIWVKEIHEGAEIEVAL